MVVRSDSVIEKSMREAVSRGDVLALTTAIAVGRIEFDIDDKCKGAALPVDLDGIFLLACREGQVECAEELLRAGCNVDAVDASSGDTGLLAAVAHGHVALIPLLVGSGAELEARDADGDTAFVCACAFGQLGCAWALLGAGSDLNATSPDKGVTGLMYAAASGFAGLIPRLVASGAELEAVDRGDKGETALMWACGQGEMGCAAALLLAGSNVNAVSTGLQRGLTALSIASVNGHAALIPLLVESGAELEARDANGDNAFVVACSHGKLECVVALLDAGSDVNAGSGEEGHTGLIFAAAEGHTALITLLVASGGKLNTVVAHDDDMFTALSLA